MKTFSFGLTSRAAAALLCASLPLLGAADLEAVVFRVGSDGIPPCTHATLPAAIAAAAANGAGLDQIYLSDSVTLSATLDINNQSVEIVGGFSDCNDDTSEFTTSVTMQANPGFRVHGGTSSRTVNLQSLQVIRSGAGGRILQIEDAATVFLYSTLLSNGAATDGANVWMSGPSTILFISDSSVYSGDATGLGGGVYCANGGTVLLESGRIGDNTATSGGGLYLDDCLFNSFAGSVVDAVCPTGGSGVVCNRAESTGGGIYATNGASVNLIGSADAPATVAENDADEGGGLYLTGAGTTADATDAWFVDNQGAFEGGAVYARAGASFTMDIADPDCRGSRCSLVRGNFSSIAGGVGGAIAADSGADVVVHQTTLTGNSANVTGSVVFAEDPGTTVAMEGCLIYANSGSLNDAYLDTVDGAALTVAFTTVAEGVGCCKGLFDTNSNSTVNLYSNILMANVSGPGGGRIFDEPLAAGESRVADCILFEEDSATLPPPLDPGSQVAIASFPALFANFAAGDYRLRGGSPAIDFCDTFRYTPVTTDIDDESRGFDVPPLGGAPFGIYDLGADEWRPLLISDHEEGDCTDWTSDTGGC